MLKDISQQLDKSTSFDLFPSIKSKPNDASLTWKQYFQSIKKDCRLFQAVEADLKTIIKIPLLYTDWYISKKTISTWNDVVISSIIPSKQRGSWATPKGHAV